MTSNRPKPTQNTTPPEDLVALMQRDLQAWIAAKAAIAKAKG